jgi:hypothetical protein
VGIVVALVEEVVMEAEVGGSEAGMKVEVVVEEKGSFTLEVLVLWP